MTASDEVVVNLADGWTLRSGVYKPEAEDAFTCGEYVRLCEPDGSEYLYWDQEEWRDDPALVMGAIINSAAGHARSATHEREERTVAEDYRPPTDEIAARLEYLRGQIRAECISYYEIAELQELADRIAPDDHELLSWATDQH